LQRVLLLRQLGGYALDEVVNFVPVSIADDLTSSDADLAVLVRNLAGEELEAARLHLAF